MSKMPLAVRGKRALAATALTALGVFAGRARATPILYEPFDYTDSPSNFLANAPGGTNSTTFPKGQMAPNSNNWYGCGIAAATGYTVANDGVVTGTDLSVSGLAKGGVTRSLSVGDQGYTMRLSLNSSTPGSPNQTTTNLTDTADPLAGTDGTLQASDTVGTGYYSVAIQVANIAGLNATGGVLMGFNNLIAAQTSNPSTCGAGLCIRPKAGGDGSQFELGIVKQTTSNFANATWDLANTYTTGSTIFVVAKYQTVGVPGNPSPAETDDVASLWINPNSSTFGGFDPAGALTNTNGNDIPTNAGTNNHTLQSIILRQNGTATNNQIPLGITYDELRVGTNYADVTPTPEPAALSMLGLGIGALVARRRR